MEEKVREKRVREDKREGVRENMIRDTRVIVPGRSDRTVPR